MKRRKATNAPKAPPKFTQAREICLGIGVLAKYEDCRFFSHEKIVIAGPRDGMSIDVKDAGLLTDYGWFLEEQTGMWTRNIK